CRRGGHVEVGVGRVEPRHGLLLAVGRYRDAGVRPTEASLDGDGLELAALVGGHEDLVLLDPSPRHVVSSLVVQGGTGAPGCAWRNRPMSDRRGSYVGNR